jgi:hypothetical protein
MRIISKKKLRDFYEVNVQSEIPLTEWFYHTVLLCKRHMGACGI